MKRSNAARGVVTGLAPLLFAIGLVSVALQVASMDGRPDPYDEGLALYGGARIDDGGVPYRDFWSLYGPANFYLIAGAFRIFGESVWTGRLIDVVGRTAIVLLAFVLARRVATPLLALATAGFSLLVLVAAASYEAPIFLSTACACAAVLLASHAIETKRSLGLWFAAGVAAGVTAALRTDVGGYAFVAIAWGCLRRPGAPMRSRMAALATCIAGTALVVVPVAAFLLIRVPLDRLFDDFIRIPSTVYAKNRAMPFPRLGVLRHAIAVGRLNEFVPFAVFLPIAVVLSAVPLHLRSLSRSAGARSERAVLIEMLILLDALLIVKGWVRVSLLHSAPALVGAAILIAAMAARIPQRAMQAAAACAMAAVGIAIAAGTERRESLEARVDGFAHDVAQGTWPFRCAPDEIERLRCFTVEPAARAALVFVEHEVPAGKPIFVGAGRHDKLVSNDVRFYFLSGRRAPTRWADLHPGVETTAPVQQQMIADFEREPPAAVILNSRLDDIVEPNESGRSSGVVLLDDWIRTHYRVVFAEGTIVVMKPRDAP